MENKTFKQLYEAEKSKKTPAQQFIADVAKLTHKTETTVKMWIMGRQVPDELTQSIIAQQYDVDATTLFTKVSNY